VETLHFFLNPRIISSEYVTKISSSRLSNTSIHISRTIINTKLSISCPEKLHPRLLQWG
jgi:hypothetical protein